MNSNTVLTKTILTIMRFNRDNGTTVGLPSITTISHSSENAPNSNLGKIIDLEQPKEAFVTYSNNRTTYMALLKVLLDSVHAFSTRPIIVFGIDVDLDIDLKQYPRVIKRRISQSDCGRVRSRQ